MAAPEGAATLTDVVEILHGIGGILQVMDARLERILDLLEAEDDDEA